MARRVDLEGRAQHRVAWRKVGDVTVVLAQFPVELDVGADEAAQSSKRRLQRGECLESHRQIVRGPGRPPLSRTVRGAALTPISSPAEGMGFPSPTRGEDATSREGRGSEAALRKKG